MQQNLLRKDLGAALGAARIEWTYGDQGNRVKEIRYDTDGNEIFLEESDPLASHGPEPTAGDRPVPVNATNANPMRFPNEISPGVLSRKTSNDGFPADEQQ